MTSPIKMNPTVVNALAFHLARRFDSQPLPDDMQVTPDIVQVAQRGGFEDGNADLALHLNEAKVLAMKLQQKEPINLGTFEVNGKRTKRIQLPDGIELPEGFHVKVENDDFTLYLNSGTLRPGENSKTLRVKLNTEDNNKESITVNELIFVSTADGDIVPAKIEIKFTDLQLAKETSASVSNTENDHHDCDHEHSDRCSHDTSNDKSKAAPWIIGLGGAVVALLGYILSEQKPKASITGIGALSLVGTAVSIAKRMGTQGDKAIGWMQGKGAWITGLGGAVLAGIPYYLTDDKVKGSLMPIGLGVIGGVLAWFFEPVRSIFGAPTKQDVQSKLSSST